MIEITAEINAPIEKVWKAYNTPDDIMAWNHASDDWYCPHAESEFIVGGRFNYGMAAKDGSFAFDFTGTFIEIEPLKKLLYTIDDGRKVEVFFGENGEKSTIKVHFEPESQNPEEMQEKGWQAILDNFKKYVETKYD